MQPHDDPLRHLSQLKGPVNYTTQPLLADVDALLAQCAALPVAIEEASFLRRKQQQCMDWVARYIMAQDQRLTDPLALHAMLKVRAK